LPRWLSGSHPSRDNRQALASCDLTRKAADVGASAHRTVDFRPSPNRPWGCRGNDLSVGTIPLQAGTDVVVAQITVLPGGSSGWHSHPGGAIVVIQQGAFTVYRSVGSQCMSTSYTAGQAFIERPGEVDQVVNTGTIPYVLFVTFPRVPQGGPTRIDQPNPGTCTGV